VEAVVLNEVSSYWGASVVGGGTFRMGLAVYGRKRGQPEARVHIRYMGTQMRQIWTVIPIITPTVIPACLATCDAV